MDYYNNERHQWKLAKLAPAEYYKFCITGEYPLRIDNPPETPKAARTAADLRQRAEAARKAAGGAGTEASDSTLDEPPDRAARPGSACRSDTESTMGAGVSPLV